MSVLLVVLKAPMQSWGASSRFTRRETEIMPTKSGFIGMLAAAVGKKRVDSIEQFQGLRFGVRVDQPGTLLMDYHTAKNMRGKMLPISRRYYLQDAVFIAAVESADKKELDSYRRALSAPYYQLFLGRRSCPPEGPLKTMLVDDTLESALAKVPWQASEWYQRKIIRQSEDDTYSYAAEIVVEVSANSFHNDVFVATMNDEPISFNPEQRQYALRRYQRIDDVILKPTIEVDTHKNIPMPRIESIESTDFFDAVAEREE